MFNKKIIIFSMLIILLIGISSVSANDNLTDEISNMDNDIADEIKLTEDNDGTDDLNADEENEAESTTFHSLNELISTSSNLTVLDHDYAFNATADEIYYNGIIVNRSNLVIDGAGHSIDGKNLARMFNVTGTNVTLQNIKFVNGRADYGGALHITGNDARIINCTFAKNNASEFGGALFWNNTQNGFISNSQFESDYAGEDGGAVYLRVQNGVIRDSNFTSNKAFYNGAVYMNSIQGVVYNCIFTNNTATNSSGALGWVKKENGTIANSKFLNNSAPRGGAVYLNNGTEFYIRYSIFENNNASENGGAIFWDSGNEGRLISCEFKNNNANEFGGAICWNNTQNGYISHSKFDNNQAYDGGSIYFRGSNGLIAYSDFTNNNAFYNGAIYMNSAYGEVDNCLFENNTADNSSGALGWVKKQNGIINNTVFISNKAIDGGAVFVNNGDNMTIDNCRFIKNNASNEGGAICWDYGKNGAITNTIFDSNTANSGGAIRTSGTINVKNNTFTNNRASDGNNDIALRENASIKYIVGFKIDAADNTYGKTAKITVTLINDGEAANNGTVSIVVDNITYESNVSNGTATIEIAKLNAGEYKANITYIGDSTYNNHTEEYVLTVNKQNVEMTAKDKSYIITYGGKYTVTVSGIAGSKITFALNGKIVGSATTDANGAASITLTAKMLKTAKAGKRNLVITLDNSNYQAQKSVKITINKEKTKLAAKAKAFKRSVKTKKFTVTLKNSKGKAVKKAKVTLKVKGKTYKATTNSKGKATFKITKLTKKGKYTAKINFKGDACYKASSKKAKITVK